MTFGQKVRSKRKLQRFSQQYLSEKTGIPQTTISDWENDKSLPNVVEAHKIASVLECGISDLLEDFVPTGTG